MLLPSVYCCFIAAGRVITPLACVLVCFWQATLASLLLCLAAPALCRVLRCCRVFCHPQKQVEEVQAQLQAAQAANTASTATAAPQQKQLQLMASRLKRENEAAKKVGQQGTAVGRSSCGIAAVDAHQVRGSAWSALPMHCLRQCVCAALLSQHCTQVVETMMYLTEVSVLRLTARVAATRCTNPALRLVVLPYPMTHHAVLMQSAVVVMLNHRHNRSWKN